MKSAAGLSNRTETGEARASEGELVASIGAFAWFHEKTLPLRIPVTAPCDGDYVDKNKRPGTSVPGHV